MLRDPDDYHVYIITMPPSVHALVSLDDDGYPTIFINARDDTVTQRRSLRHELRHLTHNDFYNNATIRDAERLANG